MHSLPWAIAVPLQNNRQASHILHCRWLSVALCRALETWVCLIILPQATNPETSSALPLQVMFNRNSQQGILDLLNMTADVTVGRADLVHEMVRTGVIPDAAVFKCVTAVRSPLLSLF